ncbi:MAG: hydrogenase maturation protein HypF [Alphaproteobacteria bacterium]|nr:hydrogenase maturation protein HypF [Alphaproteobacteria bacterium]
MPDNPFPELIASIVPLPRVMPPVLGVGAYLKNALCLIQGGEAWISRENGSLDSVEAITRFQQTAKALIGAAIMKPLAVAHDWHPDFYCSRWAESNGELVSIGVQHHHAHVAAVMAEHGTEGPTLGLALDGFGLGERKEAWGGELLRVDPQGFERIGHLCEMPQPGGDVAARQPWRMGAAALASMGRGAEIAIQYADQFGSGMLADLIERQVNAPLTSSAGRLFDAACGLLHILPVASFEGEAPMKLESLVSEVVVDPQGWHIGEDMVLDMRPTLARLVGMQQIQGANLFHGTLAAALLDWSKRAVSQTGIRQVALCGGCFFNKVLRESLTQGMIDEGITPLLPQQLLPGDTAIALGQAYAAALQIKEQGET